MFFKVGEVDDDEVGSDDDNDDDDDAGDAQSESKSGDNDAKVKPEPVSQETSPATKTKINNVKKQRPATAKVEASPAKSEVLAKVFEIDPTKPVGEPKLFFTRSFSLKQISWACAITIVFIVRNVERRCFLRKLRFF